MNQYRAVMQHGRLHEPGRVGPIRHVFEQIVRPTGLVDPKVTIKPLKGQIDDLLEEVRQRAASKKSAKGRRSSVPSWDEIMLGSSRQRD